MKKRVPGAKRPLQAVSTLLLALASSSAMALGLGDIRVLSKPGQPLLAEIAIISADPSELENLRVALASPVTFARVGLERPTGLVSELQFELTRNPQGRAVVRVSSQAPVTTPSLNFLIEADWGQGRLVREYSALVDAPDSAVAVAEPEIVAPAGAMSNAIVREAEAVPAVVEPPAATAEDAAPSRTSPVPPRNAAAAPARRAAPVTAPPAPAVAADGSITVRRGQTLSEIAGGLARERGLSRDQAMIALLRANPEAFIRGNVNLLKQGAVLRTPDAAAAAPIDAGQAAAMVREHTAQWRQARSAIPQPAAGSAAPAPVATAQAAVPAASASAADGGRLEIAPAVAATDHTAGTTTGTAAGSEGDMLGNEQLRQAKEDVATRDAEIQELRGRVAELEKLKQQQDALISLKDSDLAAAQQRLADAPAAREGGGGGWYWLGLGVLLVVVAGWALARRRKPSPLPPLHRDHLDAAALAAAVPAADYVDELAAQDPVDDDNEIDDDIARADAAEEAAAEIARREPAFMLEPRPGQGHAPADAYIDAVEPAEPTEPVDVVPPHAREAAAQPTYRGVFEFPEEPVVPAPADVEPVAAASSADAAPLGAPGRERLELAIAYLDLGDADTARALLQEVATGGDIHSQIQARELLARLP
jgi:pilus assembly protein FimV